MDELKTILGTEIPVTTSGILYGCNFDGKKIEVFGELLFDSAWEALESYANIPNPASQLVYGKTYDDLIKALHILHKDMKDPVWLKQLGECI